MKRKYAAFTLVEVVVAIGIFAVVVTALLGLLATLQTKATEAAERADAAVACNSAAAYLRAAGMSVVTANAVNPGEDAGLGRRLNLSRDLSAVGWGDNVSAASRFFAVTVERITAISPAGSDATNGFVAATLRVEWPAAALESASPTVVSSLRANFVFAP